MHRKASPVRGTVLGPPDLVTTAIVAGLAAEGITAERLPLNAVRDGRSSDMDSLGVLLVDVDLPHMEAVVRRARHHGLVVLALGTEDARERAAAAIAAGATAWVRKSSSIRVLADVVRSAATGRLEMSDESRAGWVALHRDAVAALRADAERLDLLSPREQEVLRHLARGLRAADIARVLVVTVATVRSHIQSILRKLECNTQQQAVDFHVDLVRRRTQVSRTSSDGPSSG